MQHRWVRWSWDKRFCACCGLVEEKIVERGRRHTRHGSFFPTGYRRGDMTKVVPSPRPDCDNTFIPVHLDGFDIDVMRRKRLETKIPDRKSAPERVDLAGEPAIDAGDVGGARPALPDPL